MFPLVNMTVSQTCTLNKLTWFDQSFNIEKKINCDRKVFERENNIIMKTVQCIDILE